MFTVEKKRPEKKKRSLFKNNLFWKQSCLLLFSLKLTSPCSEKWKAGPQSIILLTLGHQGVICTVDWGSIVYCYHVFGSVPQSLSGLAKLMLYGILFARGKGGTKNSWISNGTRKTYCLHQNRHWVMVCCQ